MRSKTHVSTRAHVDRANDRHTLRLLLVDDDPQAMSLIEMALADAPFVCRIECAATRAAGVRMVTEDRYDACIVDQRLPDGEGLTLVDDARRRGVTTPFILLTGYGDSELEAAALRRGAEDYIEKHQVQAHLARAVRYAIERSRATAAARDALRESELRLRAIITAAPECVKIVSRDGRLLDMNPAGLSMVEAEDFAEIAGQPVLSLVHADDRAAFAEALEAAAGGRSVTLQFRFVGLRGGSRWMEMHAVPFRAEGGEAAVLSVTRDITERRQLEEQLMQSQKMEAVGQLAGGIAHDFNNVLTAMLAYCAMIDEARPEPPIADSVLEIRNAAERAAALTRQLLTFSRRQPLRPQVVDLNAIIANLQGMLHRMLGEDIDIVLDLAEHLQRVRVDPHQVEHAILNLVLNGRDAMPAGGRLRIVTANAVLDDEMIRQRGWKLHPGAFVTLTVEDTGEGMTPDVQRRVFEPFFTTKEHGRGTGLGLATVYGIVEQSGGQIAVASEVGRGSAFSIYLPVTKARATPIQHVPREATTTRGSETILIVEDDRAVRDLAHAALTARGYRVLEAALPAEALHIAERFREPIDMLLSDVVMPGMSGTLLAGQILQRLPHVKVLLMSGYAPEDLARRHAADHHATVLYKPFTPSELADKVREVLDRRG